MTRAAQVMEVMRHAPGQEWTASEISAQLGCAPSVIRTALAGLRVAQQVERTGEGVYRLAAPALSITLTGHVRDQPTAPAMQYLPPPTVRPAMPERASTPEHRAALIQALRDAGRPLQRTALQTRTRHVAWAPGEFFLTVTAMVESGQLREWPERTLVLPGFRGRL